ncbi:hypothetical protein LEMLEM_LOCUS4835 [Lemmus lemmus]
MFPFLRREDCLTSFGSSIIYDTYQIFHCEQLKSVAWALFVSFGIRRPNRAAFQRSTHTRLTRRFSTKAYTLQPVMRLGLKTGRGREYAGTRQSGTLFVYPPVGRVTTLEPPQTSGSTFQ